MFGSTWDRRGFKRADRETYFRMRTIETAEELIRKERPIPMDLAVELSQLGVSIEQLERRISNEMAKAINRSGSVSSRNPRRMRHNEKRGQRQHQHGHLHR